MKGRTVKCLRNKTEYFAVIYSGCVDNELFQVVWTFRKNIAVNEAP